METDKHDTQLWQILQDQRTIFGFLDSVFGFLARKTDFYHTISENKTIGFPPGIREQLILKSMKKFEFHQSKHTPLPTHYEEEATDSCKNNFPDVIVAAEETVESSVPEVKNVKKSKNSNIDKRNRVFNKNEYCNGAQFENYCWSQTTNDLEIFLILPNTIRSSKHINVKIDTNYIKIVDLNTGKSLLDGALFEKCKNNDVLWSMNGQKLHIQLDKIKETWWKKCFTSESEIDTNKIDYTRSLYDLPEESQAVIEKLKWEQEQKMRGLPTANDSQKTEILRKAWNVEGSPFKGQPFDPSIVQFQ